MADIVKAVGNCSYNQLVEKIISCKQSDNSELAGEGGYSLLLSVFSSFSFHTFIQASSYRRQLLIRSISPYDWCHAFGCIHVSDTFLYVLNSVCVIQINNYQSVI